LKIFTEYRGSYGKVGLVRYMIFRRAAFVCRIEVDGKPGLLGHSYIGDLLCSCHLMDMMASSVNYHVHRKELS